MPETVINAFKHHFEDVGSGEPLVMLHGAAGSGRGLVSQAKELLGDFRAIIPDLRAMGQSAHVESAPSSAWVDDLLGLLDHLGIQAAHVYGVSLGSRIALRFAIDHPERTRSVIMDAGIIANDPSGNAALNRGHDPDALPAERQEMARLQHGDDWKTVMTNYFNIRNDAALQEYYNLRKLATSVQVPVLILRGDVDDPVHPLAHSLELHQSIPVSRLAILPNSPSGALRGAPDMAQQIIHQFTTGVAEVDVS
jgi:pimeloyl-ACP methyl ester carboxylesterase